MRRIVKDRGSDFGESGLRRVLVARLLMTGEKMGARGEKKSAAATALRATSATATSAGAAAQGTPPRLPPAASILGSGSAPPRVVGCVRWSSLFRVWASGCVSVGGREGRDGGGWQARPCGAWELLLPLASLD